MSIRHIVTWKLVATNDLEKAEALEEIRRTLAPLVQQLPELISLKVTPNVAYFGVNGDVILQSEYANLEDLETYLVHPLHVVAVNHLKPLFASRTAIDIEI
jgi:hypothetical protein